KPIWMTEFGWGRDDAQISLTTQAKYVAQAYDVALNINNQGIGSIDAMFVFNFGFGPGEFYQWDISGITNPDCSSQVEDYFNPSNLDTDYIYAPGSDEHDKIAYLEDKVLVPPSALKDASEQATQEEATSQALITTNVSNDFAVNALSKLLTALKQKFCSVFPGFCTIPTSLGADPNQTSTANVESGQINGKYNYEFVNRAKLLSSTYLPQPTTATVSALPGYRDP